MVIINSQTAKLANRLWHFSGFIANSIEYNYALVNIGFTRYLPFFESTANNDFKGLPISITRTHIKHLDHLYSNLFKNWSSFTYRKFGKTPTIFKFHRTTYKEDIEDVIYDLNNPQFVHDAQTRRIIVEGWMMRDPVNLRKHATTIQQLFIPVEPYKSTVEQTVKNARKMADVVVGVHIRRGDYANYLNGVWCFDDSTYADKMQKLAYMYEQKGKSCAFLICSNERINTDNYKGLSITFEPRHFIVDLYALAACDAIIAPPSTYSQWAAYYGGIPLYMLMPKEPIDYRCYYAPDIIDIIDF